MFIILFARFVLRNLDLLNININSIPISYFGDRSFSIIDSFKFDY